MPMKLLEQISKQTMPVEMTDPKDVFNLYILKAAGYVFVTIPLPHYSSDGRWHRAPATVRQITPLGHTVLKYLKPIDLTEVSEKTSAVIRKMIQVDRLAFKVPPRDVKIT
jgi:hypothetical protein